MPSPNRLAFISLLLLFLNFLSLVVGILPIPLLDFVCYPLTIFGGIAAMWTGWQALRRLPSGGWRVLTHVSLWFNGLFIIASICFFTFSILLVPILWSGVVYISQTILIPAWDWVYQIGQSVTLAVGDWLAQLWQTLLLWLSETGWVN